MKIAGLWNIYCKEPYPCFRWTPSYKGVTAEMDVKVHEILTSVLQSVEPLFHCSNRFSSFESIPP
jgi:hypothetical protein